MSPSYNKTKELTTLMLRNIPNKYNQNLLLAEVQAAGFRSGRELDFFHVPMDTASGKNKGYAFLNFTSPTHAAHFRANFHGRPLARFTTQKRTEVSEGKFQGLRGIWFYYSRQLPHLALLDAAEAQQQGLPLFWPLTREASDMPLYSCAADGTLVREDRPVDQKRRTDSFPAGLPLASAATARTKSVRFIEWREPMIVTSPKSFKTSTISCLSLPEHDFVSESFWSEERDSCPSTPVKLKTSKISTCSIEDVEWFLRQTLVKLAADKPDVSVF